MRLSGGFGTYNQIRKILHAAKHRRNYGLPKKIRKNNEKNIEIYIDIHCV
jgi:hypothetical protein